MTSIAPAAVRAATGTMARKMLPHHSWASSSPPTIGPSATAAPAVAPQAPMALARVARSGKVWLMIDRVVGKMNADAAPISTRHPIRAPVLPA